MSNNQTGLNPISLSPTLNNPSEGRVDLVKSDFYMLVEQKGLDVFLDKVVFCPCSRIGDRQPLSSCRNCGGTGYTYINRYDTKIILQSMNISTKFKEWSEEKIGTVRVTARDEDNLSYMDRITVKEIEVITNQTIFPREFDRKVRGKLIYDIKTVQEIFAFRDSNSPLVKLEINTDYTFNGNIITFNDKYSDWDDFTVTVRYSHNPSFHIMDMTRDAMTTKVDLGNGEQNVVMPISAIARRSHYVLDEQNYNGDYLLDNSYGINACGTNVEVLVKEPTLLRLSHPTNTSVKLDWLDPSTAETNFVIERAGLDQEYVVIAVVAPNVTTYTDTVIVNTTYFYRVATKRGTKQSIWAGPIGLTTNP